MDSRCGHAIVKVNEADVSLLLCFLQRVSLLERKGQPGAAKNRTRQAVGDDRERSFSDAQPWELSSWFEGGGGVWLGTVLWLGIRGVTKVKFAHWSEAPELTSCVPTSRHQVQVHRTTGFILPI